jgi:hypothetical protein
MNSTKKFLLLSFGTLFLSTALTQMGSISVGAVQPNLVLVSLVVSSIFTSNALLVSLLLGIAIIFSKQVPVFFDSLSVGMALAIFTTFFIKQRAVWPDRVGVFVLIIYSTLIVYLIASPTFIVEHFFLFFFESVINAVLGIVYFEIFAFFVGRSHQ